MDRATKTQVRLVLAANYADADDVAVTAVEPASSHPNPSAGEVFAPRSEHSPATALIAHEGGPRHGDIAEVPTAQLISVLVYDGPRWLGVYRRADPPRAVPTAQGLAQVWEALNG